MYDSGMTHTSVCHVVNFVNSLSQKKDFIFRYTFLFYATIS